MDYLFFEIVNFYSVSLPNLYFVRLYFFETELKIKFIETQILKEVSTLPLVNN